MPTKPTPSGKTKTVAPLSRCSVAETRSKLSKPANAHASPAMINTIDETPNNPR